MSVHSSLDKIFCAQVLAFLVYDATPVTHIA